MLNRQAKISLCILGNNFCQFFSTSIEQLGMGGDFLVQMGDMVLCQPYHPSTYHVILKSVTN